MEMHQEMHQISCGECRRETHQVLCGDTSAPMAWGKKGWKLVLSAMGRIYIHFPPTNYPHFLNRILSKKKTEKYMDAY
jgi:hypothetical protein